MAWRKRWRRGKGKPKGKGKKRVRQTFESVAKKSNYVTQVFQQTYNMTQATGTALYYDFAPSISNMNASDLTAYANLYDEYRIKKCRLRIRYNTNFANLSTLPSWQVYSVIDRNDETSLTSLDQALGYNNCVVKKTTDYWCVNRTFVPSVTVKLTDVNGNSYLQEQKPQWIQLANNFFNQVIAHLGCKVISEVQSSGMTVTAEIYTDIMVEFRNKV
nr:MAG: capsid protein [Cressdnaviricota sp.]